MNRDELRPCIVKMLKYPNRKIKQCIKIEPEEETYKGYFHTWANEAYVTNGYLTGTTAGQISSMYGIVEYEDGTVHRVPPECIEFTDRESYSCEKMTRIKKLMSNGCLLEDFIGYVVRDAEYMGKTGGKSDIFGNESIHNYLYGNCKDDWCGIG